MRTTKLFTTAAVALALLYSAGCEACKYYDAYNCNPCAPAPQASPCQPCPPPVVECPPPAAIECPPPRAARARNVRYARRGQRFARTAPASVRVGYQDLGTATLVTDPGYVPSVMEGQAAAPVVEAAPVVVAAEPKANTKVVYRRGRIVKNRRAAKTRVTPPIFAGDTYTAPVYAGPTYYAAETTPVATEAATPAEPAEVVEKPAEPAPEEPSYAKYLIPIDETPANAVPADPVADTAAAPAVIDSEPPIVVPPIMAEPVPQVAQVAAGQVQGVDTQDTEELQRLYRERLMQLQQLQLEIYQRQLGEQGLAQAPVVSEPMYALAGPVSSGFEPGLYASSYCPPSICPAPAPVVCAPGQNLSDCFTMNEYQVLNSPMPIFTPEAGKPLPIAVEPAAAPVSAPISAVATPPTAPAAPIAPAAPAIAAATAPAAPQAIPAAAATTGNTSKYEALVPPADLGRQEPPSVTMPAPLGNSADMMPPIAATSEIENALDAMLARDTQNPGMLK